MRCATLSLSLSLALCATASAAEPAGPADTELEKALFEDIADRRLDDFTFLEAALVVSGAREHDPFVAARRRFRKALDPLLDSLAPTDPEARAEALLRGLHTGLLRKYESGAVSLLDVDEDGRFNCVGATVLFVAAARELELDVRAMLLPTHVRAELVVGGRRVVIETTSKTGVKAARSRFVPQGDGAEPDLGARGTEIDDIALLGLVYLGRASRAGKAGDKETVEALDARAEEFVVADGRLMLRRARATILSELAIHRYEEGDAAGAIELARKALKLSPDEGMSMVTVNLGTFAQHRLADLARAGDDAELLAFAEQFREFPGAFPRVRWTALDLAGGQRAKRGDAAGAAAAARESASLKARWVLDDIANLGKRDPDLGWTRWRTFVPRLDDADFAAARKRVGAAIARARAERLLEDRNCTVLDARVAEWMELEPEGRGPQLRASCQAFLGVGRWISNDFDGAAAAMRSAMKLDPDEPAYRQKLLGILRQQVGILLEQHRCAEAAIEEGLALAPSDELFLQASRTCTAKSH